MKSKEGLSVGGALMHARDVRAVPTLPCRPPAGFFMRPGSAMVEVMHEDWPHHVSAAVCGSGVGEVCVCVGGGAQCLLVTACVRCPTLAAPTHPFGCSSTGCWTRTRSIS